MLNTILDEELRMNQECAIGQLKQIVNLLKKRQEINKCVLFRFWRMKIVYDNCIPVFSQNYITKTLKQGFIANNEATH